MASPFKHFRKYTGVLMVFLTVLLMVAFGLQDILGPGGGPSGGGRGPDEGKVAVSWKGGQLTNGELRRLVGERQILQAFQAAVYQIGAQVAAREGTDDLQLSVQPLAFASEAWEQDAVNNKIYADAAHDAGMAVSDEAVRDFIDSIGRGNVGSNELRTLISQIGRGSNSSLTPEYLFSLLREALLARNYSQSYAYTFRTVLPQQRLRDWIAVNDRVVVEAAALPIEQYLDGVGEPTDVELEEFFTQYKDQQPGADFRYGVELPSPTPGFAVPRRVSLQFLRADYEATLDAEREKVTDEDIAKYYEENKSQFIQADDLLSGDDLGEDLFKSDEDSEADSTEDKAAESSEPAAEAAAEEAAEEADGSNAESEADSAEQEQPATEAGKPDAADDGTATDGEAAAEGGQQSARSKPSPFRFVALQEDSEGGSETEISEADDSKEAVSEEDPEVTYQPLDEVSDSIRRRLADERATGAITALMESIRDELLDDYNEYFTDVVAGTPEGETPPPPPESVSNLKAFADKHGLELGTVDEADVFALRETEVGKSVDLSRGTPDATVTALMFALREGEIDSFEPILTISFETFDRYLFQRTAELPAKTPELDEVRDEVVAAWKRQKAGEAALEAAKKFAEQAEENGGGLATQFAGDEDVKVVETATFSRYVAGVPNPQTRQTPLSIGQPDKIEAAGPDFLEAVFELKDDEVGAALNHDKSIAYVVRIVRHIESPEQLRQGFLNEGGFWIGQPAMDRRRQAEVQSAFINDLVGEDGVDWKRPPDQRN